MPDGTLQAGKRQKAAIILRYMLAQGSGLPLADLPEDVQIALTRELGTLPDIDRALLSQVADEFAAELEALALTSGSGVSNAANDLAPYLSDAAKDRLLSETAGNTIADPWDRLRSLPLEARLRLAEAESVEVCAILLSKLPVPDAAETLRQMPGDKARRAAYTMSRIDKATPEIVLRTGNALAETYCKIMPKAFSSPSGKRVAAILNSADSQTRDALLTALEEENPDFGRSVRLAIFTFADIATRLAPMEVPAAIRGVEEATLVTALAFARFKGGALATSADHILANMSKRMAENLREAIADRGDIKEKDGEDAFRDVIGAIRALEESGEIALIQPEEEES